MLIKSLQLKSFL